MAHEVSQRRVQTRGKFPVLASGRTSIRMPAQSRRAAVTRPPSSGIELRILLVRGQKVLIDAEPGGALWRADEAAERAGEAKRRALPRGFLLSAHGRGVGRFEVAIWALKPRRGAGGAAVRGVGVIQDGGLPS